MLLYRSPSLIKNHLVALLLEVLSKERPGLRSVLSYLTKNDAVRCRMRRKRGQEQHQGYPRDQEDVRKLHIFIVHGTSRGVGSINIAAVYSPARTILSGLQHVLLKIH